MLAVKQLGERILVLSEQPRVAMRRLRKRGELLIAFVARLWYIFYGASFIEELKFFLLVGVPVLG